MSQQPDNDLQAELAAVRQRLGDLEAKHRELLRSASRSGWPRLSRKFLFGALPVVLLVATGGLLYGQGAGDALFIHPNGNVGIGTTSPGATLDVSGKANTDKQVSLQLRSGNNGSNFESNQITFGWSGSDTYRHTIKSRHNRTAQKGNALDFYVWKHEDGDKKDITAIGGFHTMTLDDGNVGIGTTAPDAKLDVAGTVKAKAFEASGVSLARVENALVPVGTIMAYGGDTADKKVVEQLRTQGWLPCDGATVKRGEYGELFQAIETGFGAGDGKTNFQVPDLRGRFLRGTDQKQKRDPDSGSRRAEPKGGNSGDKVGSIQDDTFGKHTHGYTKFPGPRGNTAAGRYWAHGNAQTASAGGEETRPKNVYVNWIIKAKHLLSPAA